jgi:predicted nucleotidyltransferase
MIENQEKQNVLGIIAEYNPFHNGHLYHLTESKRKCNAKYAVAIISGNFTQRGDASIVNKFEKAKMAIENGIDMVIELPTLYSISSAENFANGAIKILNELNFVTHISFGSESGNINQLNNIASVLTDEPEEFSKLLKEELRKGSSFPVARQNAIEKFLNLTNKNTSNNNNNNNNDNDNSNNDTNDDKFNKLLKSPNNILAIEYLKALKKTKSNITPITIERKNVDYYSENIVENFASSTKIRKEISENLNMHTNMMDINNMDMNNIDVNDMDIFLNSCMPRKSYDIIKENIEKGNCIQGLKCFEDMIFYKLRSMQINEIKEIPDVCEGLENVIKKASNETNSLEDLINKCKSKRYTRTRIQRILIYALLGITRQDMEMSENVNPYIRVLAVNKNGRELLSIINKSIVNKANVKTDINNKPNENTDINNIIINNPNDNADNKINIKETKIITSLKKFESTNEDKALKRMMEIDKLATDIYTIKQRRGYFGGLDYTMPIFLD